MPFWKRDRPDIDLSAMEPEEPLDPPAFLELMDDLGRSCADEVARLGGDSDQVLATIWFAESQQVSRVQLTSDGSPMPSGKAFSKSLSELAAPLRLQPPDRRVDRLEVTVADGRLSSQVSYRD